MTSLLIVNVVLATVVVVVIVGMLGWAIVADHGRGVARARRDAAPRGAGDFAARAEAKRPVVQLPDY